VRQSSKRQSSCKSSRTTLCDVDSMPAISGPALLARSTPNRHDAADRRALSINICWISLPRPAPIESRRAISRSRAAARAISSWRIGACVEQYQNRGDPAGVRQVDPRQRVADVHPMAQYVSSALARPRLYAVLLGAFASLALLLSAIGLYGLMAYAVSRRTHEIGVRMALGAQQRDVLGSILGEGARLAVAGLVAGVACAIALSRLVAKLLYGVTAGDLLTYAGVVVLLGSVALIATWIPARGAEIRVRELCGGGSASRHNRTSSENSDLIWSWKPRSSRRAVCRRRRRAMPCNGSSATQL
jgi:FtsX-like permease family